MCVSLQVWSLWWTATTVNGWTRLVRSWWGCWLRTSCGMLFCLSLLINRYRHLWVSRSLFSCFLCLFPDKLTSPLLTLLRESRSPGPAQCHERCRDNGQAGPALPTPPQLVHPGHVRHQRRRSLRGPGLAGQSAEEQKVRGTVCRVGMSLGASSR